MVQSYHLHRIKFQSKTTNHERKLRPTKLKILPILTKKLSLHVESLIEAYRNKRDCMANALKEEFGDDIEFDIPKGGMFFCQTKSSSYARLNFTSSSYSQIQDGTKRIREAYRVLASSCLLLH